MASTLKSLRPPSLLPSSLSMLPPSPASRTDWSAGEGRPSLPGVFMADDTTADSVVRFPMFPGAGEFAHAAPPDVFAQPVLRTLTPEDLRTPSLLVLLRWAARARATGTLVLRTPDGETPVTWLHGRVYLTSPERAALLAAFTAARGAFVFIPNEPVVDKRARAVFQGVLLDGVRAQMHPMTHDALAAMFGERLRSAAVLRVEMEPEIDLLSLTRDEERFAMKSLTGDVAGERLVAKSPLGRRATLQLLAVLSVFDYIDWVAVG